MLIFPLLSGFSVSEGGRIPLSSQRVSQSPIKCVVAYVEYFNLCILFILREEPLGGLEMRYTCTWKAGSFTSREAACGCLGPGGPG